MPAIQTSFWLQSNYWLGSDHKSWLINLSISINLSPPDFFHILHEPHQYLGTINTSNFSY
ncbi:hypothetical protein N9414_17847 [Nodularia spumigena CCY9414]|nr:hypothetical protein N9414_17847 [Nodularia spumigena CCY9414]